jgi:hypothetical protein
VLRLLPKMLGHMRAYMLAHVRGNYDCCLPCYAIRCYGICQVLRPILRLGIWLHAVVEALRE